MEREISISIVLVMCKSVAIWLKAGAIMEDVSGEMELKPDTMRVAPHFLRFDQFLGLLGLSGPSQVTLSLSVVDHFDWCRRLCLHTRSGS